MLTLRTTTASTNAPTPLALFSATVTLGLNWMKTGCDVNVSDLYMIELHSDPKANGKEYKYCNPVHGVSV